MTTTIYPAPPRGARELAAWLRRRDVPEDAKPPERLRLLKMRWQVAQKQARKDERADLLR